MIHANTVSGYFFFFKLPVAFYFGLSVKVSPRARFYDAFVQRIGGIVTATASVSTIYVYTYTKCRFDVLMYIYIFIILYRHFPCTPKYTSYSRRTFVGYILYTLILYKRFFFITCLWLKKKMVESYVL